MGYRILMSKEYLCWNWFKSHCHRQDHKMCKLLIFYLAEVLWSYHPMPTAALPVCSICWCTVNKSQDSVLIFCSLGHFVVFGSVNYQTFEDYCDDTKTIISYCLHKSLELFCSWYCDFLFYFWGWCSTLEWCCLRRWPQFSLLHCCCYLSFQRLLFKLSFNTLLV